MELSFDFLQNFAGVIRAVVAVPATCAFIAMDLLLDAEPPTRNRGDVIGYPDRKQDDVEDEASHDSLKATDEGTRLVRCSRKKDPPE